MINCGGALPGEETVALLVALPLEPPIAVASERAAPYAPPMPLLPAPSALTLTKVMPLPEFVSVPDAVPSPPRPPTPLAELPPKPPVAPTVS